MKIFYQKTFFKLLLIQFLERLGYTIVLIQLPIYIAQKDVEDGLGWEQDVKGIIFFIWAMVQNLTPIFAGNIADRTDKKIMLSLSLISIGVGFFFMLIAKNIPLMILATILLGLGSGAFKPTIQGEIAKQKNSGTLHWAAYIFVTNLAFFTAGPISKMLREIDWKFIFLTSFFLTLLNLIIVILTLQREGTERTKTILHRKSILDFKTLFSKLKYKELYIIVIITACFSTIYMQFYETLPNFIYDWSDTSSIVKHLKLPNEFTMLTDRGIQISYEWLFNINPFLILLFAIPIGKFCAKFKIMKSISLGLFLTVLGFSLSGFTMKGELLILGIAIYTFGEMMFNINAYKYIGEIATDKEKATFYGLLNISYAFGFGAGALAGGVFYKHFGEKITLAEKFASQFEHLKIENPLIWIKSKFEITNVTEFLWSNFHPYLFWLPFIFVGIFGLAISLIHQNIKFPK
ncbi:MAG: MFS transporter [Ignavibacteria bacterium]|nr:MFS transporter [Ignavibacteria bacterium]